MIELMIAPRRPVEVTWNDIADRWRKENPDQLAVGLPNGPVLRLLGSDEVVQLDTALAPELYCRLDLGRPNNIGLSMNLTEPLGFDEVDMVEGHGRNLPAGEQARIAAAWRRVGYFFAVDSTGGRPTGELDLIAGLAIAIAALTDGIVITEDNYEAMGTGVGVFTAEEFRTAMWHCGTTGS